MTISAIRGIISWEGMPMMGIYEICNLHDGKATAYVGSSNDIEARWSYHKSALRHGTHHNRHLQRAWDKYGEDAFEWGIIEEVVSEDVLLEREQCWLARYLENPATCYNIAAVAEKPPSWTGKHHAEEAKEKIGRAHRGELHPMWGRTHTTETKRKMSKARKGKPKSEAHKEEIGAANAGAYSAFVHRETGEMISAGTNLSQLCRGRGLNHGHMWAIVYGKRKSHKGWVLLDD